MEELTTELKIRPHVICSDPPWIFDEPPEVIDEEALRRKYGEGYKNAMMYFEEKKKSRERILKYRLKSEAR